MNRELKFRAWHKVAKNAEPKMTYWSLKQGYGTNTNFFNAAFTKRHGVGAIMQFTGLLDREGKEIYEGDILWGDYFHTEARWVVEFGEDGEGDGPGWVAWPSTQEYPNMKHNKFFLANLKHRLTIIGNIHESPELLQSQ